MKFKQKVGTCFRMNLFRIITGLLSGMMFLFFTSISLTALSAEQQVEVKGKVVSASDQVPVIGATVVVKGTTNGTTTNIDGEFFINASMSDVLNVTFIGYKSVEVDVTENDLLIELEEDITDLEEVVVIGYGVQKKKLSTGATTQVKGDNVQKMSTTNPLQAMQGQAPGISISSTSGQPGADMKVTIRGLGTVGNSDPLYIIDGVEGDITNLNASDIESIDILKDAASAAIYGSQAANGVVLVTTKKGSKGNAHVTFDGYYGLQIVGRTTDMLNANEYQVIMNEQALNSGASMFPDSLFSNGADTDWVKQMFYDNAVTQNYSLSVSGGSETSVYAMSLNYTGQEGIVGGPDVSNYERYGFRLNSEHKLYDGKLTVGQSLNFTYKMNTGISVGNQYNNTMRGAFVTSPIAPVFSDNNIYDVPYNDTSNSDWYKGDGNPYGQMIINTKNKNNAQNLLANFYAELEPIKNLRVKSLVGLNYYSSDYRSYSPLYQLSMYAFNNDHTSVNQSMSKGQTITWTNTASYDFNINEDHQFNVLGGMEAIAYDGVGLSASNWNILSQFNDFAHAYLDNTTGQAKLDKDDNGEVNGVIETKGVGGGPAIKQRRLSYFGRLAYNYQEKYMFNATLRADASSKFAAGYRWGYFPSASFGWVMTNEDFMENNADWLTFLKMRLSWGRVGNQNIDDFQYAAPINTSTSYSSDDPAANYVFGTSLVNTPGAYPSRLSNEELRWETSEQSNVGIDAYLFDGHMGVNGDFYIKTTKDWLVRAPILATAGAGAPYINGGDVKNTGIELALSWNDEIGDVSYTVGVNGAYNKNEVGNIPTEDGIIHGLTNMLYDNSEEFYRAENGHPIGYFWGYETDGIFQNENEIAAWKEAGKGVLQADVKPGDVRYVDQDNNGVINAEDKIDLGCGIPDFTYGFNVSLAYRGFDFSVNANGVYGNEIVQSYRNHANKQANYTSEILNRWTGEGTSNTIPRVTETNVNWQFSDLYLNDGSYLRINNITLGYDFKELVNWKYLSQCRVYASVQNAFTFTTYNGMDPEIGYGTSGWVSGIDLGYYPRPQTYMLGVNIKF
ncbi:MAG: TonB-dependent receptor [Prolixibacteraceae bacterium]|jgi:TonB-linked SusC/RagA family outer membrane protein|nr:TonB-dependent receptor [Prolixibacteraceae bacterium]